MISLRARGFRPRARSSMTAVLRRVRRMPRKERSPDAGDSMVLRFARELRLLREKAGSPTCRERSARAHCSEAALARDGRRRRATRRCGRHPLCGPRRVPARGRRAFLRPGAWSTQASRSCRRATPRPPCRRSSSATGSSPPAAPTTRSGCGTCRPARRSAPCRATRTRWSHSLSARPDDVDTRNQAGHATGAPRLVRRGCRPRRLSRSMPPLRTTADAAVHNGRTRNPHQPASVSYECVGTSVVHVSGAPVGTRRSTEPRRSFAVRWAGVR
jgi:hypothetical protein